MAYTSSAAKANMILSNPFCVIRTIGNKGISYKKYFSDQQLGEIFTPYHYPLKTDSIILSAPKNVMIFVLESFSAEHSALLNPHLYPQGGGYTPFLDSLMEESYYFTRAYANGNRSIEVLPSVLSSTPSFKRPFVLMSEAMVPGMSLPRILSEQGYRTMFSCGSPTGSMGFDAYANVAGIGEFFEKENYDRRYPGNKDFDGYWGIWDEQFIDYMGEVMGDTPEPFMNVLFTISSHHPFKVPERYRDMLPKGTTAIHRPVAYTDMALRKFFEKYGEQEWFRNTVFLFCADHVSSEKFAPETFTTIGRQHIITLIHTPDGSIKGRNEDVFQQLDIMPTLLGILGYDEPYFAFGRDIFNEPEREPFAINYNSNFQMITDSLSIMFDENHIIEAYSSDDRLQENNIMNSADQGQERLQRLLEAIIQQYYEHVEAKTYTVPSGTNRQPAVKYTPVG